MDIFATLNTQTALLLLFSVGLALAFEFVNGFHDTANAVATVIYTKSLKPTPAVLLSGICNFLGVYAGGIAVAYAIVHLLPVDLLVSINTSAGLSMIFALLTAAIIWNFGTWYLGLPASSSHTLIGSILGVGMCHALMARLSIAESVNWLMAAEVGLSLFISPLIGFACAWMLLRLSRKIPDPRLQSVPDGENPPPAWIRSILILSGAGVSFAHGSNDGQKGVGLIMLILIGIIPSAFVLNPDTTPKEIQSVLTSAEYIRHYLIEHHDRVEKAIRNKEMDMPDARCDVFPFDCGLIHAYESAASIPAILGNHTDVMQLSGAQRWKLRTDILCLNDAVVELIKMRDMTPKEARTLNHHRKKLLVPTEYAPKWVLVAVAAALGVGTMIGWKRVAVTIGEKIGNTKMTYSMGGAAQLTAMAAIGLADGLGMPVSTTHVLSTAVAGSMAAANAGIRKKTMKSIALAWILTLPAAMLLGGGLYALFSLFTGTKG